MKRVLYIIAGFVILSACTSKPSYKISGTIDGLTAGVVVLLEQRIDKEYVQIDSVNSPDGTFEFTGSVEIPDVYYVSVPGKRGKALIFLENSLIGFTAHADTLWKPDVSGSAVHDEYNTFQESLMEIYGKARELYASYREADQAGDEETAKKLEMEIDAVDDEVQEFQQTYLDENPNVVSAYQKYTDKGFEVLGVSLDNSRDKWLKAVKDDGLLWTQVSDLKYWSNEAAALYGISSIPSNLLLDREGLIIKKNLRGEDLHSALEELLH